MKKDGRQERAILFGSVLSVLCQVEGKRREGKRSKSEEERESERESECCLYLYYLSGLCRAKSRWLRGYTRVMPGNGKGYGIRKIRGSPRHDMTALICSFFLSGVVGRGSLLRVGSPGGVEGFYWGSILVLM